jgi:hypothetical protein
VGLGRLAAADALNAHLRDSSCSAGVFLYIPERYRMRRKRAIHEKHHLCHEPVQVRTMNFQREGFEGEQV